MTTTPEHRMAARVPVRLSADVRVGGQSIPARTRNLSAGGVCLEGDLMLPEGEPVVVSMYLVVDDVEDATRPELEVAGRVAWVTPEDDEQWILGVRFERLSPQQAAGLTRFLQVMGLA